MHVNWPRLLVLAVLSITGTLVGFEVLTSLLAVQLAGGFVETWAKVTMLFCATVPNECGSPSMRMAFMVAMGIVLSIASIPVIVGLYPRPPKDE